MPTFKTICDHCGELKDDHPCSQEVKYIGDHVICLNCIASLKIDLKGAEE
jgi:formylmethanofuran dehydrogenase subunit E